MVFSDEFNGLNSEIGKQRIIEYLELRDFGKRKINFRLRDWLISRQRYWGTPIPVIHCPDCGIVPVAEENLPVTLPYEVEFKHSGESPLTTNSDFINVKCPKCGSDAKRDADTMDTFVDSSWYYFRYLDPHIKDAMFDKEKAENWVPVDMYVGGAEHATMHLLYARFIHKFLRDLGLTNSDEPFQHLLHQGTITNDGAKMSKSRGNVVNPGEFTSRYGSDVFRMYLMFMGPYELGGDWSDKGISGVERFVLRTYDLFNRYTALAGKISFNEKYDISSLNEEEKAIYRKTNQTVKKFEEEISSFRFNTAIASLMELINELKNIGACSDEIKLYSLSRFAVLLAPVAPHLAEECWQLLGNEESLFVNPVWFKHDAAALVADTVQIAVQVNGKLRDTIEVPLDSGQEEVKAVLAVNEKVAKHTEGKNIVKEIYVKNKIYNIVVK